MKSKFWLALLPAACLSWQAHSIPAQRVPAPQSARTAEKEQAATGSISGVLKDPSGAVIFGAKVEVTSRRLKFRQTVYSDDRGHFIFHAAPAGHYRICVTASGFASAMIQDVSVTAGDEASEVIALKIAAAKTFVEVNAPDFWPASAAARKVDPSEQAQSGNTAEIVATAPGVSLRENGQLASVPLLHGLGDERTKLVVDGMTISSSCPNHMNPPLTYAAPARAAEVAVMAGITPVSLGGDSLGGTIVIESSAPAFANRGERLHEEGASSGFYRSNGKNYGGLLTDWVAGGHLGIGYSASWATNDDYTDGGGHKVTSTYAQTTDHTVTLAARGAGNLVVLEASLHHTPYEGFVSAQMDMVRNYAESMNFRYRRNLGQGSFDAHVFWQNAWHSMNIGKDKSTFPMPMWMPMNTHGRDTGYSIRYELPLSAEHILRVGNEAHRFVLDDRWPAVPGSAPMMGPNTFVSINDGRRIRLGTYGEAESKWNAQWTTLLGIRNDTVWTNAGPVQGYSGMMYGMDADAFNASSRAKTDVNLDLTALVRWEPNAFSAYEAGYARKTRSPNLYERYAWSTNWMASGMIGWFGDGNYYVGNVGLKPETANTVSGTAMWRDRAHKQWEVKLTPFLTAIDNYVDVNTLGTTMYGMSRFAQLQFANHSARIYGGDFSGASTLWNSDSFGVGKLEAAGGWLHGERTDTNTGLYQMMPLNLRANMNEEWKGLVAGLGIQAVDRKSRLDPNRMEQATPGYTLFNLHTGYRRGHFDFNAAADNLFNREYEPPLGGVNFDDFMASMWMSQIKPLTGRGRSASISLTAQF